MASALGVFATSREIPFEVTKSKTVFSGGPNQASIPKDSVNLASSASKGHAACSHLQRGSGASPPHGAQRFARAWHVGFQGGMAPWPDLEHRVSVPTRTPNAGSAGLAFALAGNNSWVLDSRHVKIVILSTIYCLA